MQISQVTRVLLAATVLGALGTSVTAVSVSSAHPEQVPTPTFDEIPTPVAAAAAEPVPATTTPQASDPVDGAQLAAAVAPAQDAVSREVAAQASRAAASTAAPTPEPTVVERAPRVERLQLSRETRRQVRQACARGMLDESICRAVR